MNLCRLTSVLFIGLFLGCWVLTVQGVREAGAQIAIDSPNPEAGGWFGSAVTSADVNGDGRADIVVGARLEDVGSTQNQGRVYVFEGCTRALIHTLTAPGSPSCGAAFGCRFGQAVSAGDITGDGREDIVVGAPFEDVGGNSGQGRAYVFDGATGGLILALNTPNPHFGAHFGDSVAAGDVNGDGRADIIVGGSGQCISGPPPTCAGQVFVFDGMTGALIHTLNTPNPFPTGLFGKSVASGDLNGDGRADIVVGGPGEFSNRGRVYIFNGATGGLMGTLFGIPICNLGHPGCWFGSSVAVIGPTAILIGAPMDDVDGVPDQGRAYVFSPAGGAPLHMLTTPSPGSGCTHECNRFGVAVAADDVNGDGQADFIVGANAEIDKQGKVYVFSGADGTLLRTLDSPSPVETNEVLFGSTATAADVDADGKADIIVGAFRDDVDGVVEQGRAYLFFPSGLEVAVALEPDRRLRRSRTATVRATVTRAGVPQSCAAVAFSTTDPTVASVSPTSAVTDASGQTQASVHGESRGETTVTAVVDGASASAPVKVPDLSLIGVVLSVFCVMLFGSRAGLPLLRRSKTPERSMSATTQLNLRFATVMAVFAGVVFLTYREEVLGALLTPVATVTAEMTLVMLRWAGMVGVRVATVISHPDGFAYEIYYRCTGFLPVAFVTLAILASPGPLRRKVIGLALGVPVLIVLNLTRLVHLFYVGVHSPAAFDFAHAVVWEGLLILAIFALWLGWARWPDSRATSGVH